MRRLRVETRILVYPQPIQGSTAFNGQQATKGWNVSGADRDEFTRWAAARRMSLVRSALVLTVDHGHAEDLVQQAMVKVAMRWGRLHDGNPDAYARTVIYRDYISWWRKRRDVNSATIPDAPPDTDEGTDADMVLVMRQALARLTPKQRAVLALRFYEDLSERDTATALGVSQGTVKSQTAAALQRLRDHAPEVRVLLGMEEAGDD
jgi:RNA polymerase sigma-70 factor (sigma-E family)